MSNFANSLREASQAERAKHAAALKRELQANGVPSARDLSRLALLKSKYPLPSAIFDELLAKLRTAKPEKFGP
jgi:hypothetical protein